MLMQMYVAVGLIVMVVVVFTFIYREMMAGAEDMAEVVMVALIGVVIGIAAGVFWPLVAFATVVIMRGDTANRRRGYHG